jgi:hypothetical protein
MPIISFAVGSFQRQYRSITYGFDAADDPQEARPLLRVIYPIKNPLKTGN